MDNNWYILEILQVVVDIQIIDKPFSKFTSGLKWIMLQPINKNDNGNRKDYYDD